MDHLIRGRHMSSKRVYSYAADEDDALRSACTVEPGMLYGVPKRRQVASQISADFRHVEPVSEPADIAAGYASHVVTGSIGDFPDLLNHRHRCAGHVQRTVSTPCSDPYAEYNQFARSLFRRVYYDLSRGIDVVDSGIGYLFKSSINDISTSTYGMYGEIRPACLMKICDEMRRFGLDERSVVVDLGSGRGAPNFLFAHHVRVFASIGIELCPVSYALSVHNLLHYLKVDVARSIRENTCFGGVGVGGDGVSPIAAALAAKLSTADSDNAMQTPRRKRHTKDYNEDDTSSCERTASGVNDSVVTQYEGGSTYADSTSATPTKEMISSNDDGEAFYRAMHRVSVTPSSLGVGFCNEDISAFDHFEGASHLYSFDIAMEKALVNNIVRQFANTRSAWLYASFNGDLIERFELRDCFLASRIPCQMYKSGERRFCYIYVKNNWERLKMEHDAAISEMFGLPLPMNCAPMQPKVASSGRTLRPRRSQTPAHGGDAAAPAAPAPPLKSVKSVLLSQFDEPVGVIESVKLAKMPLEAQIGWYSKKIARPQEVMTRSKVVNSIERVRMGFVSHRSKLLELIATSPDPREAAKYVGLLRRHIQQKYMPMRSFAPPSA
ncbi:hypothetical protein, conserved [Babesia bigemina]|uniref:DOT1 domain-containing protein n=1 Tax=Babesia bigemina TaxID=5866 RepID=A0A061D8W5_BABBI|nr:hypothetical protein, conserved [Babesia bigemina]CDR96412.1 hypothetical protein, conserved [Babesia bigemina]|eukprot:XP_012768598.1 hypothetical protein, conserved [Babesia bigemina]